MSQGQLWTQPTVGTVRPIAAPTLNPTFLVHIFDVAKGASVSKTHLRLFVAVLCSVLLHATTIWMGSSREFSGNSGSAVNPIRARMIVVDFLTDQKYVVDIDSNAKQSANHTVSQQGNAQPSGAPSENPRQAARGLALPATEEGSIPPVLLTPPTSPEATQHSIEQGFLVIEVEVDSEGRVTRTAIINTNLPPTYVGELESAAYGAIFEPARQGNRRVEGRMILRFEYRPSEPESIRYEWIPNYQPGVG